MAAEIQHGSPLFSTSKGTHEPSPIETMDRAIQVLQEQKDSWAQLSIEKRIILVEEIITSFTSTARIWNDTSIQAKGIEKGTRLEGEELELGAWPTLQTLLQLRIILKQIQTSGLPGIPGPIIEKPNGQLVAQVFPFRPLDRVLLPGVTAEIWMQPEVTKESLAATMAIHYKRPETKGKVALVLGAGNVSSIITMDTLYKLFVENSVVLLKANPVNDYLGLLLEESFLPLIESGYLQIVYGGATEGAYLCQHADIDEIHITGSDKTFDAIVFGDGETGAQRKAGHKPLLTKPISSELGNVSPIIVVPGPWTAQDLAYQAEQIASSLAINAGFNCNATRILIQQKQWKQRIALLDQIKNVFTHLPLRKAYYPGAQQRYQRFLQEHPEAEQFGTATDQQLPWTIIPDVDVQNKEDICFTTEAFCSLFAETALDIPDVVDYIDQAVQFANEQIWGTLNVTLLVHPTSLKDPRIAQAIERALDNLHYGTIGLNCWAGIGFTMGVTTWGAFPGNTLYDARSGMGMVHNNLMFDQPQKTVLRGPFRSMIKPVWFVTQGHIARQFLPLLIQFEGKRASRKKT